MSAVKAVDEQGVHIPLQRPKFDTTLIMKYPLMGIGPKFDTILLAKPALAYKQFAPKSKRTCMCH